ncbi:MAG: glutathione peroxidase [Xanthobacteraceae bacterium]|nr:glutathione peroxidase [Xanthobacteraceae bacterium]
MPSRVTDFSATALAGEEIPLISFQGQVLLIVNTASACGFTLQYRGLEELQQAYAPRGFSVLGFPCNQFGEQEPGSSDEIAGFCSREYAVTFPMFAKIEVNGDAAHPLYKFLKGARPGLLGLFGWDAIKWNFTKFLVGTNGHVVARYSPITKPESLKGKIEKLLSASA